MTEREKYENCRKERALITDFLAFAFAKYRCYLGKHLMPISELILKS